MYNTPSLLITNATKTFSNKKQTLKAVDEVSLKIDQGQIYGLLGPNGAGKSTLINLITGALLPDSGKLEVFGVDVVNEPQKTKQLIGVVPQEIVMELAFTVYEVLYYFAGMYGVPVAKRKKIITDVLESLDLQEKTNEKAQTLSGGMKRRLMVAKAILHQPKFLILDEPTAGVDVSLRQKIWNLVRKLNSEGTTILFTTHYLEEAERLCESITLIDRGRIIKDGKLKDILKEFSKNAIHFELFDGNVQHLPGVEALGDKYEYPMSDLGRDMNLLTSHYNGNIKSIRSEAASLEQIFLKLTGS